MKRIIQIKPVLIRRRKKKHNWVGAEGELNPNSKLSDKQASEIRKLYSQHISAPKLAIRFGVSTSTVNNVVNGRTYSHLGGKVVKTFDVTNYKKRKSKRGEVIAWVNYFLDNPKKTNKCIIWPFSGSATVNNPDVARRMLSVPRLVCEKHQGPPPKGKNDCAHSCGNGHIGCINPRHLRWASRLENVADTYKHDTRAPGARDSKLTKEKRRWARKMYKRKRYDITELAGMLKTSKRKISLMLHTQAVRT